MRPMQWLAGSVLALSCGTAMALGLGQIQVKSKPGQPLLAEIPIISNVAGELDGASARLAPPEVFARVGLEPPRGVVGGLQFEIVQNAQGRMVVRVTSSEPVQAQALNFLVEVDWGRGRLVREYSALVDAPQTAATLAQPPIEAPLPAPSDAIAARPVATEPLPEEPAAPHPEPAPVARSVPVATDPFRVPRAPTPAPSARDEWKVERGQSLSQIARRLNDGNGATLDQTMMALLHANPEAFIGGNINRLKTGAVLRVPAQDALGQSTVAEASALVREQMAQWRQSARPVPQPATAGAQGKAVETARPVSSRPVAKPTAAPAKTSTARLEIAPAAAGGKQVAGTKSGIAAGGEGDMLANEQLRQAREDVASRDSEIQELRTRVAELEQLQQQQQKLIALKDSDLASAQQRLAESRATPAQSAKPQPQQVQPTAKAVEPASREGTPVWLWGGVGLVLLGLVLWLRSRRRAISKPVRPRFDVEALAAAAPNPPINAEIEDGEPEVADIVEHADAGHGEETVVADEQEAPAFATAPEHAAAPEIAPVVAAAAIETEPEPVFEHAAPAVEAAGDVISDDLEDLANTLKDDAEPAEGQAAAYSVAASDEVAPDARWKPQPEVDAAVPSFAAHTDFSQVEPVGESHEVPVAAPATAEGGIEVDPDQPALDRERLDLAIAYLDMGDTETAREMLAEAVNSPDAQVRGEAEQLLREIG